jgi:hypothetical protein
MMSIMCSGAAEGSDAKGSDAKDSDMEAKLRFISYWNYRKRGQTSEEDPMSHDMRLPCLPGLP